jgi:hypothetical protein
MEASLRTAYDRGERKMKTNSIILALALGIACMQSASAQTFKKVNVNNNTPLAQVASGGNSVWALANNGNPYRFNGTAFVLANPISLSQIAVGGGNAAQADAVWGLNSSGSIYRASKSGASWIFSQVPGVLAVISQRIPGLIFPHSYARLLRRLANPNLRIDSTLRGNFVQS